jgi:hypothetical protein
MARGAAPGGPGRRSSQEVADVPGGLNEDLTAKITQDRSM